MCSNGDGRTGVFLSLCLSIERLETEDNVDIFQTVRWLRSQRAGLVSSQVNKLLLTLSALLGTDLPNEDRHHIDRYARGLVTAATVAASPPAIVPSPTLALAPSAPAPVSALATATAPGPTLAPTATAPPATATVTATATAPVLTTTPATTPATAPIPSVPIPVPVPPPAPATPPAATALALALNSSCCS